MYPSKVNKWDTRMSYKATIICISRNPVAETRYNGCLPNSSLKADVTSGITPNPSAYMLNPKVAWNSVQPRSRIIEGNPILYEVALAAKGAHQHRLGCNYQNLYLPTKTVKVDAITVMVHFLALEKFIGFLGSFSSKVTC